ncbi:MAG: hypothetical protein EOM02_14130 [Synergistales bacterium]|nr:hypothetical protein [Synergistales bacterium]
MSGLDAIQGINRMLARLRESKFWRDRLRGCPKAIGDLEDLSLFPVLTEEDLMNHGREMVLIPPGEVGRIVTTTSGTTGPPKRVYLSRLDLASTIDYFEAGLRSFCHEGQRILVLYPGETDWSVGSMLMEAAGRMGLLADPVGSMDLEDILCGLKRHRWDILAGTPAQMAALTLKLPPLSPGDRRLVAALSSGATLTKGLRERFEEATGAEIYDHWGCREGGYGGALECSFHVGLHLRQGIWAEVTKSGDLLITTYGAHCMPLLRYKTGDRARIETDPCGCSDPSPRIFPMGRIGERSWDPLRWEPSIEGWGKAPPSKT